MRARPLTFSVAFSESQRGTRCQERVTKTNGGIWFLLREEENSFLFYPVTYSLKAQMSSRLSSLLTGALGHLQHVCPGEAVPCCFFKHLRRLRRSSVSVLQFWLKGLPCLCCLRTLSSQSLCEPELTSLVSQKPISFLMWTAGAGPRHWTAFISERIYYRKRVFCSLVAFLCCDQTNKQNNKTLCKSNIRKKRGGFILAITVLQGEKSERKPWRKASC